MPEIFVAGADGARRLVCLDVLCGYVSSSVRELARGRRWAVPGTVPQTNCFVSSATSSKFFLMSGKDWLPSR